MGTLWKEEEEEEVDIALCGISLGVFFLIGYWWIG